MTLKPLYIIVCTSWRGGLNAIRDLLLDPDIRSIFEINSASLILHQANRIEELAAQTQTHMNMVRTVGCNVTTPRSAR